MKEIHNQNEEQMQIPSIPNILTKIIIFGLIQLLALHLLAWKLFWLDAWIFTGLFTVLFCINALWLRNYDPKLLVKRLKPKKSKDEWKSWDKKISTALSICTILIYIVSSLDGGRFQWVKVSQWIKIIGLLGFIIAYLIIHFIFRVNNY